MTKQDIGLIWRTGNQMKHYLNKTDPNKAYRDHIHKETDLFLKFMDRVKQAMHVKKFSNKYVLNAVFSVSGENWTLFFIYLFIFKTMTNQWDNMTNQWDLRKKLKKWYPKPIFYMTFFVLIYGAFCNLLHFFCKYKCFIYC